MKTLSPTFVTSLEAAQDRGIAPLWFFHVQAKPLAGGAAVPINFWSGDEDITLNVQNADGSTMSRVYYGGCNLMVSDIIYTANLTDNPVTVTLSAIAPMSELLGRGYDLRMAYCEIHSTTRTGGALTSVPELQWVGIIDEAPISTATLGGSSELTLSVRSELMTMLTAINPAKSSNEHQLRRDPSDGFSRYSGVIGSRTIQWYNEN